MHHKYPTIREQLRTVLGDGNTVAAYRAGNGLTGSSAASAWASYAGTDKYLALPGVANNYLSTPDSVANSITGDIDIRIKVAMADWTPAANAVLVCKWVSSAGNRSYRLDLNAGGNLILYTSADGTAAVSATSSVATGITDGATKWVRATRDVDNGSGGNTTVFYTSDDGVTWSQLGTAQTNAGTTSIRDNAVTLIVGASETGGSDNINGKVYAVQIYNGIAGSLAVNLQASDFAITSTNGATATASTGEVWTLNNTGATVARIETSPTLLQATGANQPTINADGSLTFDGSADYMSAAFTVAQPLTIYIVGKQITWTLNDKFFDTTGRILLQQTGTTPTIGIFAGTGTDPTTGGLAVDTRGVIACVFNGASSSIAINGGAATTGNPGTAGFTNFVLGASFDAGSGFGNIQMSELIIRNVADSAATQARIQGLLKSIYGV